MGPFHWLEEPGQLESLALCLRSLTALAGPPADYDELVVELGLGSLVVADARRPIADWQDLARNELLVATAERCGVRLRDLHPRRAAIGLETSAEFPLHFTDSYVPLIERALASAQLVLAWRGWPPPFEGFWGIITQIRGDAIHGHTLGHSGEPLSLISPAHQIYVVEEITAPATPGWEPPDAFARAVWALGAQESGNWSSDWALRTGSSAWLEWGDRLGSSGADRASVLAHRRAALQLAAARTSLHHWLAARGHSLTGASRAAAKQWAVWWAETARRLRMTVESIGSHPPAPGWLSATIDSLRSIAELDRAAAEIAAPFARPVAIGPAYEAEPLEL